MPAEAHEAGGGAKVPGKLRVERVDGEARLAALIPAWRALATEAAEKNQLMEPAMALPAWRHVEGGTGIGWLFVWRNGNRETNRERLIAVMALANRPPSPGLPFRTAEVWRHGLGYLGTPLIHRRHVEEAVSAVLDWLQARGHGPRLLRLRQVGAEGPIYAAFRGALAARGLPLMEFERHRHACLSSDQSGALYLRAALGRKRLKEYRRLEKRLAEKGALSFQPVTDEDGIERAAEDFLKLEQSGWKGRRGTALAQDAHSLAFFREMMAGLVEERGVRMVRLMLGDRALAVAVLLVSGDEAWLWKIAFDEVYARFSPGAQLVVALTGALLDGGEFRLVDSCAAPDHPMIDHIWRERIAITDALAVIRPGVLPPGAIFATVRAARAAQAAAKTFLAGLRR